MQVIGDLEVLVPMAGLIDVEAELARLDKEKEKAGQGNWQAFRQAQQC